MKKGTMRERVCERECVYASVKERDSERWGGGEGGAVEKLLKDENVEKREDEAYHGCLLESCVTKMPKICDAEW